MAALRRCPRRGDGVRSSSLSLRCSSALGDSAANVGSLRKGLQPGTLAAVTGSVRVHLRLLAHQRRQKRS